MAEPPAVAAFACAPLRVSLAGGGTDLASYAAGSGGLVVSTAIRRYVAVTVFPRSFDGTVSFLGEQVAHAPVAADLAHPMVRAALLRSGIHRGVQITASSDVPSGTGLGGSGAFTVALLHALRCREPVEPAALAEEASAVERVDLARPVGKQDHYLAAYGGVRILHIDRQLRVEPEEVAVSAALQDYLRERLLLFYTGSRRDAGLILRAQDQLMRAGSRRTAGSLAAIHAIGKQMGDVVRSGRVDEIGPLLHEHWRHKARLSDAVSTRRIDAVYQLARSAGSDGGKLLGAGGGGFLLISARPGTASRIRAAMAAEGLTELPFDVEDRGCRATSLAV